MVQTHWQLIIALILLCASATIARKKYLCPLGFNIAFTKSDEPICYRQKGPEPFSAKFKDCPGNLYTSKLYHNLNITRTELVLWAEYKSTYPGGPFIDWSFTESTGDMLLTTYDVNYDKNLDLNQEYCVVIDPVLNFTTSVCDDEHYRYCFIKPYPSEDDMSKEGCEELPESWRFYSPVPTCLKPIKGVGGGTVRATWRQAEELCQKKGGALLSRGWRYSNNPLLHMSGSHPLYPLGIEFDSDGTLRYDGLYNDAVIPSSEWNFAESEFPGNASYGAIKDSFWYLVNGTYIFLNVICESPVIIRSVSMHVSVDSDNKVILQMNDTIDESNVYCYTDSSMFYPKLVKKTYDDDTKRYILKPIEDGYYWCLHIDSKNFHVTESNRVLFVREKTSLVNLYAIKISLRNGYRFENLDEIYRNWKRKLREYIFYYSKYTKVNGVVEFDRPEDFESALKQFKNSNPGLRVKEKDVITLIKIKHLYLDATTALVHLELNPEMLPVRPGTWDGMRVQYMKPAYYCKAVDAVPMLALNQSTITPGCRQYSCLGDFNLGVQWVKTVVPDCVAHRTRTVTDSYAIEEPSQVTMVMPTVGILETIITPQEQLQQVMDDLDALINNDTAVVVMEDIKPAFDQVDELLADTEDLDIPGELLHLLDNIGSRLDLNGTFKAAAVRDNIALLVADAQPQLPVRGLRIAARDTDVFTDEAFEIIRDEVNSTHLNTDESEVVVALPPSVANSSMRISFVVFRNDRAFQSSNHSAYSVNSRVLSINVENTTEFRHGEVIDIHLTPMLAVPEANLSRSCGYWHFLEDGSGFWSQEGCVFIRAAQSGMLDTCRCDHLTHFAEILIPRTSFSDAHEDALQILSVVGCVLSITGLLLVGLTAILFRSWRRDFSNKIWLHLCVAIFLLSLCFLIVTFVHFETYNIGCMLLGILLHYSVLASFCWMVVAAVLSYRRLVLVFTRDASHKLLRASAFAWGVPCAIVGILLSVAPDSYSGQFGESATNAFCYPSGLGLWLSVYAPMAVMLFANWTLFILIVRSVFASRRIQRHGDSNEALRCASVSCLLVFLFGLPWIFGLFGGNIVTVYFFVLTASYQGFVLFLFFVVGNKKTRDLWLNKLKIKQTRKIPVTSSTFTNKSTNGNSGWRAPAAGPAAMAANHSKPRSLSSSDDSRFS